MGPIRPPFAFDGLADTSLATVAKSSPAVSRARTASAFFSGLVVFADVDHGPSLLGDGRNLDEDLAERHCRRFDELLRVGLIVLTCLFLGNLQLAAELFVLHLLEQELLFDVAADVADRHAFLLERGLELLVVLEPLVFPHRRQPAVELLVAQVQTLFAAQLDDQQLVDGVDQQLRRDLGDRLLQFLVVLERFRRDFAIAERGNLPFFELALGDDVAVHLDQNLLQNLG